MNAMKRIKKVQHLPYTTLSPWALASRSPRIHILGFSDDPSTTGLYKSSMPRNEIEQQRLLAEIQENMQRREEELERFMGTHSIFNFFYTMLMIVNEVQPIQDPLDRAAISEDDRNLIRNFHN